MDRVVTVKFYSVERKNAGHPTLNDLLAHLEQLPLPDLECGVGGLDLRLERCRRARHGLWAGEIIRLQTENKPGMGGPGEGAVPLELPEGYGLIHSAAFVYHSELSIIGIQSARNGITPSKIATYLDEVAPDRAVYVFLPILRSDALRRIRNLDVRKIHIKVAQPRSLEPIDDDTRAVADNFRAFEDATGGPVIEMSIGAARGAGPLKRKVIRLMSWFKAQYDEGHGDVKSLRIEGETRDGEETDDLVNLLKEHLQVTNELELPDDDLELNFRRRIAFLERAFVESRDRDELTTLDEE